MNMGRKVVEDIAVDEPVTGPFAKKEVQDIVLYLDGISVSFDGFKALNKLSFFVNRGELRAIIGPNGAGKTTMMDVVTGRTRPDDGQALFNGDIDLTRHDEAAIANLGIGRKFQKPTIFEKLSVADNLELALRGKRRVLQSLFFQADDHSRRRIDETLDAVMLTEQRHAMGGSLSHGQKQWLEIGMLLMQDPDLLLVDEPVAGMTDAETEQTATLLSGIAGEHSVVVVEHDMEFVRALNCQVTVMHEGSVLAEGSLEHVQKDSRVIEVYLGR